MNESDDAGGSMWVPETSHPFAALTTAVLATLIVSMLFPFFLSQRSTQSKVQRRYADLSRKKQEEVSALLVTAKEAGLSYDGFRAWCSKQPTKLLPEDSLLSMTATELCKAMADGIITSEYLVRFYVARSMLANEKLNCVTEQRYVAAVEEAKVCDAERLAGGGESRIGPMHGLPVSIKEQIGQAGFDATCGACCRLFKPCSEDAVLVTLLRSAGAIPICRTNVPQLLMLPETFNLIYGTTCNPHNVNRTCGGSSGGEGALIAARASPLGLGTDVGGSIRIPAALNGICGFKPTVDRLSYRGVAVPRLANETGQREVRSSPGPMARCVDDLELAMAVLCRSDMYHADPTIPPMPWDHAEFERAARSTRLKFGYYKDDGWFTPAPACTRAVEATVAALRDAGHEVVEFPPIGIADAAKNFLSIFSAEGGMQSFIEGIEGEQLHESYAFLYLLARIPNWVRTVLAFVLRRLLNQHRMAQIMSATMRCSAYKYWQVIVERQKLREAFLERFRAEGIDALLCPAFGLAAFSHGLSVKLNQACSYTFVFNSFNFPAGTIAVGTVRADEQWYGDERTDSIAKLAAQECRGTEGLPVGVQVVGVPWREEKCLGAMKVVESALRAAGHELPRPPPL